jgi:urea carboxylase
MKMFNKILIANRGAIATRIIRTLKQLGIESVAIYAESDSESLHVQHADESYSLGEGNASQTYLNIELILEIAQKTGAQAIHPGYGFLSENSNFVARCEQAGIHFIGPTTSQIEEFGLKHKARALAEQSGVPLLSGSSLLGSVDEACRFAQQVGYPIMLKTTAGGGGIGMQLCQSEKELKSVFDSVKRLGGKNFADDGVFLEKFIASARHIEVQVIGDGKGTAISLGERDCSSQRRNQKVIEECPAPNLKESVRKELHLTAERLLSSVNYRNAGTVEFIFDNDSEKFYFLEVNTRLQVEHGVTEEVYGLDIVEWMIRVASDEKVDLRKLKKGLKPDGHSIQVRIYAEDPWRDFQPCPGLLSRVNFPKGTGIRIDHWIDSGIEIPPYFDPMIAKVIVKSDSRDQALKKLDITLSKIELFGSETNLDYLINLIKDPAVKTGKVTTQYLNRFEYQPTRIEVQSPGTQTTIQDYPGRVGYWHVGVPPSGPFDSYSFRLGNRSLGNDEECSALEITLQGPVLKFGADAKIIVTGASIDISLDQKPMPMWDVINVNAGQTLSLGRIKEQGARAYLAIDGGFDIPSYLGAQSTFTLGKFGGHNGRALRAGDVLRYSYSTHNQVAKVPETLRPNLGDTYELRVIYGPHGSPDYFTGQDISRFFEANWEVHYNSSRTGIRLIGPKPDWARSDGGEAGLHPSNIHDNAYAFGTVDFTGDMPVILGPDGPSLGGFVCPATVVTADLWKLGQLKAGNKVRFKPITLEQARMLEADQTATIRSFEKVGCDAVEPIPPITPILKTFDSSVFGDQIVCRAAGDHFLLVEYGEQILDIRLRFRAHALMQWLEERPLEGIKELTPGIRSLQIHYDSQIIDYQLLIDRIEQAEHELSSRLAELTVPSRIVHIPLSWDDIACQQAIDKYQQSVRKDAPWCPSNLEFIRRINGLASIDEVKKILFESSYLVMGLGDVYLGAPVATPVDPRHRLVTTKYNPARTWTAENSVGIGGSYLCVYGMEGPGGYQFVGRTLQMWNRYKQTREFTKPWLLRFFDQIRFYEVTHDELKHIRRDFPQGRYPLKIEKTEFSLSKYEAYLESNSHEIDQFNQQRTKAFTQELERWHRDGQFNFSVDETEIALQQQDWPDDATVIDSPVSGSAWKITIEMGQAVSVGDTLMILESMKMEIPIQAHSAGIISKILVENGSRIVAGQALIVIEPGTQK